MTASALPLAVTMGDPAGIGPEIVVRALAAMPAADRPVVVGDPAWLARIAREIGSAVRVRAAASVDARAADVRSADDRTLDVLAAASVPADLRRGEVAAAGGAAAYASVRAAVDLALAGRVAGVVTAPIHKAALSAAGVPFPGHTEMLAHHAGGARVAMMLATSELRVVLVTIHLALREAIAALTIERELEAIRFAELGARALGIARPRLAVAGLNPHAGEGGLFGREEIDVIAPAVAAARAQGVDVAGPLPGDTVFLQAREGRFDAVVAQYHDQGLIPIKYLGLAHGVNVTLGLPFVRTSPDHGTAFDIAPRFIADPTSLAAAVAMAARLSGRKGSTFV